MYSTTKYKLNYEIYVHDILQTVLSLPFTVVARKSDTIKMVTINTFNLSIINDFVLFVASLYKNCNDKIWREF